MNTVLSCGHSNGCCFVAILIDLVIAVMVTVAVDLSKTLFMKIKTKLNIEPFADLPKFRQKKQAYNHSIFFQL